MKKIVSILTAALLLVSLAACQQSGTTSVTSTTATGAGYVNNVQTQETTKMTDSEPQDSTDSAAPEASETIAEEDRLQITGPEDVIEQFEKERDKYTGFFRRERKEIIRTGRMSNGRITQESRDLRTYNPDEPLCFEVLDTTIDTIVTDYYYKEVNGARTNDFYMVSSTDGHISKPSEKEVFTDEEVERLTAEGLDLSKVTTGPSESITTEGILFDTVISTEEFPLYNKIDGEIRPEYVITTKFAPADKETNGNVYASESIRIDLRDGSIISNNVCLFYLNEDL